LRVALILGVDGQDGSYLTELLLLKGYSVVGWSPSGIEVDFSNIEHLMDRIIFVRGDLGNQTELNHLIEEVLPDEVYNFAAPSSPTASWNSTVEVGNIAGLSVARILEALRINAPKARFYQASTSELFGDPVEEPQDENTPFRPRNPYGIAKLYGHWIAVNYRKKYNLYSVSGILIGIARKYPTRKFGCKTGLGLRW